jgi:hypothetical protein
MNVNDNDKQPIPLIQFKDNKFEIPEQAKIFLNTLKNPLGIVTIVGKYRTGKSLFLNKVLLRNSSAFKVCPTINSCTKGLWMWKEVIKSESSE